MESLNFVNPFANATFAALVVRLVVVYGVAGMGILLMYRGSTWAGLRQSNLVQRYMGWLLLTPLYLAGIFSGRIPGLAITALFVGGAIWEYCSIAKLPRSFRFWMLIMAGWSIVTASYFTSYFYSLPLVYFMVFTVLAIRFNDPQSSFKYAAYAMYGSIWLSFSLSHIVLLGEFNNTLDSSRILLFLVLFAVACADVGGYVFGKLFHKLKLLDRYKAADQLSPHKTYTGTLGYIIGAGLAIWLLYFGLHQYMSGWLWASAAVIIGVFAFVGGLTHSFFKRYFGVKDSGQIIPGHGGVIDRIDSIARVVVIVYYFLLLAI